MRDPKDGRRRRPPIANTYWRGPPGQETLWARIEIKGKPVRWSLRLHFPLRPGDIEIARTRIEARREGLIAAAHYGDARQKTGDAVLSWADQIVHQVAPSTVRRYGVSINQLKPFLEETYVDQLDRAKMREIVEGRRAAGASTATIRRDLTALASVIDYAIDQEWLEADHNPALARLKRLTERRDPIVLPDHAHIARVIRMAPAVLAPLIEAGLKTGCCLNELVNAERANLDHGRRQLTISKGKGNKLRVIDLGAAYDVVRALPVRLGSRWLFWQEPYRAASKRFHDLVADVAREAQRDAERAGHAAPDFRPFRFHDLRHRFAVDYLKVGGSIYTLQQHLGHTSVQTTEIYLQYLTP